MLVTESTLQDIDKHWAVLALGEKQRDRVLEVAKARLVSSALGQQVSLDFRDHPTDSELLDRLALAYEMAAIEGLNAVLHPSTSKSNEDLRKQCHAGAWRAFELQRLTAIPDLTEQRLFHVMHLAALAYCGDRWSDLRRWFSENQKIVTAPSVASASWDKRLFYRLYDCWVRLFRKNSWDDLDRIREIVAGLRDDQHICEAEVLNNGDNSRDRHMAIRLVCLYHWAKATELLAVYMLQGTPAGISEQLDKHFESAQKAAAASNDATLEILQRWLHVAARQMVAGCIWRVTQTVNSRVTEFVKNITKHQAMFELLPPQRAALQEQGLLDQASRAVIVEMPTSGGKTLLAEFRMLQALNQFDQDHGWIAYVAPTRALVAQITRRLRRDFAGFDVRVEQLTGAIEIDSFEEEMLTARGESKAFDVLVCTPEKLQLVIRNKKVERPLALLVLDEAHNMEDNQRGLRIELLLATARQECDKANFLLLMPYVPNAKELTQWLARGPDSGRTISMGTSVWKPNERIVGIYESRQTEGLGNWTLHYETLVKTHKALDLKGTHQVGGVRPSRIPWSKSKRLSATTATMAGVISERGTSIAVGDSPRTVWGMARQLNDDLPKLDPFPDEIGLVQRFLKQEISPDFELVEMLNRGIGVHHAGLSDEARTMMEWLAEEGKLRVLCATTTIAQGINFPVSSVFLQSINHYTPNKGQQPMGHREFWNLAGRAGRFGHDSVGVVGLATNGTGDHKRKLRQYVCETTADLVSQLIHLLDEVESAGRLNDLQLVIQEDQWRDFRCYVAHLWAEKRQLEQVLADTEQLLRSTYGYSVLNANSDISSRKKASALLDATKGYVRQLAEKQGHAILADSTGFAPEGVGVAIVGLNELERKLSPDDWEPATLFGNRTNALAHLIGVMMRIPELRQSLEGITPPGKDKQHIAELTKAWVGGLSLQDIAKKYFLAEDGNLTTALTHTCKAIYRTLTNTGPWGIAALSKMPTSGLDFEKMSDEMKQKLNALPSMIYHGVHTSEAILMRMNSAPRSVAERLGVRFAQEVDSEQRSVSVARDFIKSLDDQDWAGVLPEKPQMSGGDCRRVWNILAGEA
jgi:superfamily II DNA/RNA helicase